MKKFNIKQKTVINRYEVTDGETIEQKIDRIINNKEPITDGAPIIYTEREEGVLAGYNIRTDRFELAAEAGDAITKSALAKREARAKERKGDDIPDAKIGGTEPIQATDNQ